MKHFLLSIALCTTFFSCGNKPNAPENPNAETGTVNAAAPTPTGDGKAVLGTYTGDFEPVKYKKIGNAYTNKITIAIDAMDAGKVAGHSVVAGNSRPFSGTYTKDGKIFVIEANEPGDDKYDGRFSFTIYSDSSRISGTWRANDDKLAVTERKYSMPKREFSYNPDLTLPEEIGWGELYDGLKVEEKESSEFLTEDVLKYNASKQLLKKSDIENLYKGDIEVLRNSIYARHGYTFKNRKMRFVFDKIDWYMPLSTDVTAQLTDVEKQNVDLLKRFEQHAERYYDAYGR